MKSRVVVFSFLLSAFFVFPGFFTFAAAATLPAGFPQGSLWLSKTQATAGDSLDIFTVLYNSSATTIHGAVTFAVDGAPIGTKQFDLGAGASVIESVAWRAVAGSHKLSASLEETSDASTKQSVSLSSTKTNSVEIAVAAPPPPTAVQQAVQTTSNIAAAAASTSLPILTNVAQNVFAATEALREKGLAFAKAASPAPEQTSAAHQKKDAKGGADVTRQDSGGGGGGAGAPAPRGGGAPRDSPSSPRLPFFSPSAHAPSSIRSSASCSSAFSTSSAAP